MIIILLVLQEKIMKDKVPIYILEFVLILVLHIVMLKQEKLQLENTIIKMRIDKNLVV